MSEEQFRGINVFVKKTSIGKLGYYVMHWAKVEDKTKLYNHDWITTYTAPTMGERERRVLVCMKCKWEILKITGYDGITTVNSLNESLKTCEEVMMERACV